MKKKKIEKKLGLKKITIANLSDREMQQAQGGGSISVCTSSTLTPVFKITTTL